MSNYRDSFGEATRSVQPPHRRRRWLLASGGLIPLALIPLILLALSLRPAGETPLQPAGQTEASPQAVNVLLIGYDSREGRNLSDVLMIARVNPQSGEVRLLSIPRDFYVPIPGASEPYQKINAAYAIGGPALAVRTVENFTNIPIDHYAAVDFQGFTGAVDAVGGVPVEIEQPLHEKGYSGVNLDPGRQVLGGEQALAYVRYRHNEDGDLGRVDRQQKLLKALQSRVLSAHGIKGIPELVSVADEHIHTDLSRGEMISLATDLYRVRHQTDIEGQALKAQPAELPGKGSVLIPDARKNTPVISRFEGPEA